MSVATARHERSHRSTGLVDSIRFDQRGSPLYTCMVQASKSDDRSELLTTLNALYRAFYSFAHTDDHGDKAAIKLLAYLDSCGPQRLSDLPKEIPLDLSTISRHCASLTRDGLLERAEDPTDGRAVRINLTPAGRAHLAKLRSEKAALLKRATEYWKQEDVAQLTKLLNQMSEDLDVFAKNERALKGKKAESKQ